MSRNASNPDGPGVVVDEIEHIEPAERHGVDAEEVASDQTLRLSGDELRPGWT
jgi:hypothetical protein